MADPVYPWTLHTVGTQGQVNFFVSEGAGISAFYEIGVGTDWDSDGVNNDRDSQPSNPASGILSITIDNPLNGSVLN